MASAPAAGVARGINGKRITRYVRAQRTNVGDQVTFRSREEGLDNKYLSGLSV